MAGPNLPPSDVDNVNFDPTVPALPEDATPEQKDAHWLRYVYKGDQMPQLTFRAVIIGGLLGMVMAASNLYTTLAIGWAFGVAITACVTSFVVWNFVRFVSRNRVSQMSILENTCMASTASAAGYATGSTVGTMFGALLLLTVVPDGMTAADIKSWNVSPWWLVGVFTLCTGLLGVFLAIPMKRQMINHEQLRFPSGVAAAETLRNLYAKSKQAVYGAYALVSGMIMGLAVGILNASEGRLHFIDVGFEKIKGVLGFSIRLPEQIPAEGLMKVAGKSPIAFGFEPSVLLIAAGIITRLRVCLSMLAGSCLLYFVVGPWLVAKDQLIPGSGWYKGAAGQFLYDNAKRVPEVVRNIDLVGGDFSLLQYYRWALWGGTSVMVFTSFTALALQWRTIARAFTLKRNINSTAPDESVALKAVEVPNRWMFIGMIPLTIALVIVQYIGFQIEWWAGLIAVAMSFVLSLVASRATGETDTTPIGAMGKVMQLLFAVIVPGKVQPNLGAAGVAANSAIASADLLTDLKIGYLLGANPRKQFFAQFIGVFFGTVAIVPIWFLMVPDKATLERFPAPGTRQWEAVARILTKGIDQLPVSAQWSIIIGAIVGIVIPSIERLAPKSVRPYLPSAMGLGLSWVVPFSNSLGFAVGAILGKIWELGHRRSSDLFAVAIASGLIAGESLTKAFTAILQTVMKLLSAPPPPPPGI